MNGKTEEPLCCIEIGTRQNGQKLMYKIFGENVNPMAIVTGNSGSGKTNFSYHIIKQALKQGMVVLVPDYSGSFEIDKFPEFKSSIFSAEDFPVSPFKKMSPDETKETTARRCADLLGLVFRMGTSQKRLIEKVIMQLLYKELPVTISNIANEKDIAALDNPDFERIPHLDIYNRLNIFEKSEKGWDYMYNSAISLYVIKFNENYTRQDQVLFSELLLLSLFEWLRTQGQQKSRRKIQIHLDEAQDLNYSEKFPLPLLIRQGRKFGCSVFLYTQSLFTFDTNIKEIMTQAALLVNFKQTPNGARQLAKLLESDDTKIKEIESQLKHFKHGEAFAYGSFLKNNGESTNVLNVKVNVPLVK